MQGTVSRRPFLPSGCAADELAGTAGERPDDIIPLAEYFIERYAASQQGYRLSENARQQLLSYEWPGNVRELDNVIQRSLIMARGLHIQAVDLMLPITEPKWLPQAWLVPRGAE
ncbi:hypothetical protein [Aeromonas sp. 97A]|uniref:hypothetical protein n=1 Tax=Aeromonas sp. 97A TaxID=3452731 RepID=UPI003F794C37